MEHEHARSPGRSATALPAHTRGSAVARHLRSNAGEHRIYGTGPVYRKIGSRVVYRVDDLERWVDKGLRTSTSDPGTDTVLPPKRTAR